MNFWAYIGVTRATFEKEYLDTRLVNHQSHPTFPLDIYSYGRECVHGQKWDSVTMKCRGIIVNRETGDIVARPFEKFFNFGDTVYGGDIERVETLGQPVIWEKVDGFMCTGYKWDGKWYVASKGSFDSPHAKWATAQIQRLSMDVIGDGDTPVFEGVNRNLRIVVDYGEVEELVLLAIIDNETCAEIVPERLQRYGARMAVSVAELESMTWQEAHQQSYDETIKNAEGYVLTWYRQGAPPFRLKVKFADYLRLHRMVTGVSPKHILEVLQNGWATEMNDMLNESTLWFNHFVAKWKRVIETEAMSIECNSKNIYDAAREENRVKVGQRPYENMGAERKAYALVFNRPENKKYSGVLFAMLDGKDWKKVIWKMIKDSPIMKGGRPMVNADL